MKKVYITGIAGLLGSNIATELADKYEISGVDCIEAEIQGIKYDVFDVCDYAKLRESIDSAKPNVLIHTIAVVNVDRCEENEAYARKLNSELTRELSIICSQLHIKMIYISTDAVFDGEKDSLYTEEDIVNPLNVYAKTKYEGECFVRKNVDSLILRTNIYGINVQNKNSFGEWVVKALKNDENLNMFEDIIFSPILVNDLALIIGKCIESNLCGLYHACATGGITKYDFGIKTKEVFRIQSGTINKATSDIMNFKAKRAKNMGMSNKKLRDALDISIRTPEESIERFYQLYTQKIGVVNYGN